MSRSGVCRVTPSEVVFHPGEGIDEVCPRPRHPGADGAHRAAGHLGGLGVGQAHQLGEDEGLAAVGDLLTRLDADRREAFVLTQVVGLSYAEAAEVAGCPVGTIRSRVARARADLVDALDEGSSAAFG